METIVLNGEFFNAKDTLDCGQIFRYKPINDGFLVFSGDKACFLEQGENCVKCTSCDAEYFKNFFDAERDYSKIFGFALNSKHEIVQRSAQRAKGVRILNQQKEEMLFSFIISQNNMIPRIKSIIEKTCEALGDKKTFDGIEYYTFPSAEILAKQGEEFFKKLGYGYRARYMVEVSQKIASGEVDLESLDKMPTARLKKALMQLKGVGAKVADCISLFGYHRVDSFPVDTWIEKLYKEDFGGAEKNRNQITDWFLSEFGEYSGYVQQYLFYYKRSLEKNESD